MVALVKIVEQALSQPLGNGIKGTERVERRTLQLGHPHRWVVPCLIDEDARQARLADPGFAANGDDLSLASDGAMPAVVQDPDLGFPADDGRERRAVDRLKAALRAAKARDAPHADGCGDPLERPRALIQVVEPCPCQPLHSFADGNRVRFGDALEARGDDHRVADRPFFGRQHDHQSAGDADPDGDVAHFGKVGAAQGLDDVERRADRPLRFIFVGLGVAEERHDSVAQPLEDVTLVPLHARRARVLVRMDDGLQDFRIDPVGQFGVAHHVAEEHRQVAPLTNVRARRRGAAIHRPAGRTSPARSRGPRRLVQIGNPPQHPLAVSE